MGFLIYVKHHQSAEPVYLAYAILWHTLEVFNPHLQEAI
jgi:hypothetical protein